jgi:hypothetical protein
MNRRSILLAVGTFSMARAQRVDKASALDAAAVAALLRKTSELYQQASSRCAFEIRFTTPPHSDVGTLPPPQRLRLTLDGEWYRFERDIQGWAVRVAGPTGYWEYMEIRREYIERPHDHPRVQEGRELAQKWMQRMIGRFGTLSEILIDASFQGWREVKTGAGKHRCAEIRIQPSAEAAPPKDAMWKELLSIHPDTGLVWKSVLEGVNGSNTTLWDRIVIGEPASKDALVFKPPRNNRKVKEYGLLVMGEH